MCLSSSARRKGRRRRGVVKIARTPLPFPNSHPKEMKLTKKRVSVQLLIRITGWGRATHTHTPTHSPRLTILFAFFTASRTSRFSGGFEGRPIVGLDPRGFFLAVAAARSFLGAIPPVLLRAVCLVRAMLFQSLRVTLSHPLHTPRLFLYSRRGSPARARLPPPPYSPAAPAGSF